MKVYSLVTLFFCIFLINAAAQYGSCPQNNNRDLLQTGLIEYQNLNKRQLCKQILINYQVPNDKVQIAASVISTQNYHVSNGVDYAVKVGYNRNNKFTATLLSDSSASWTKITVSYIVASRSDILMGSLLIDSFNTLKCLEDQSNSVNTQLVSSVVSSWTQDFLSAKAVVFVSGIKTISQQIDSIKIGSVQINSSGIINIKVTSSKGLQIEFLQLTYILVSSAFPYNFGYQLNHPQYEFPVFQQFLSSKLVQVKWGISTGNVLCDGKLCPSTCVSKDECTKLYGNLYNGHCFLCQKGTAFDGQQCISVCNKNQIWNSQSQQCVCISTAIRVKSDCNVCPSNSTPDKLQRQCICDTGYIWNNWKSTCLQFTCPVNSQPICNQKGYECVCKQGFYKNNQVCKLIPECPLNSIFDIVQKKCLCTLEGQFMSANGVCISCGKNQSWDQVSKKCVCKPNFINLSGSCVACPTFSTLNSDKTKCVCNQGYIWSDWKVACVSFKCPVNSLPQPTESGVKCNCRDGYYLNGQVCELIPKCPIGSTFDSISKVCVCTDKNSYLIKGSCTTCPANSAYNGTDCACNNGYVLLGGNCVFVCGKNQVVQNGKCVCNTNSISINNVCQQCPVNSAPSKDKMTCFCNDGFKWDQNTKCCVKVVCPQNSTPQYVIGSNTPNCVCNDGFILQNGQCVRVYKCPVNSVWSQQKLCCVCTIQGQYMINNQCQKCGVNQYWNDREMRCVCNNGFNLINGECKTCDVFETYNPNTQSCQCSLGYFKNAGVCCQCHSSCGTCSGTAANQCVTCVDVTFNFKNGSCTKQGICPKGLYQRGSSCAPCSTYCSDCKSQSNCITCIDGFQMQSVSYGGVSASYCVQKCGDGRRFELDCDDGNNKNGDGCSADCKIQSGWTCTGGSSTRASSCIQGTPQRTYLQLTGTVHLYGRIVQGIRLSCIPDALTMNDCAECYNLLWIRVIKSDIVPGVRVSYLPKSRFQFLAQFDFQGTFAIPNFNIAVQINPDYAKYFSRRDMAQIQIRTIDPSVLAMKDKQQTLALDDIIQDKKAPIKISNTLVQEIFN